MSESLRPRLVQIIVTVGAIALVAGSALYLAGAASVVMIVSTIVAWSILCFILSRRINDLRFAADLEETRAAKPPLTTPDELDELSSGMSSYLGDTGIDSETARDLDLSELHRLGRIRVHSIGTYIWRSTIRRGSTISFVRGGEYTHEESADLLSMLIYFPVLLDSS